MKNSAKTFLSLIIIFVLVSFGIFISDKTFTFADYSMPSETEDETKIIYYFSVSEPVLDKDTLESIYGDYDVYYDVQLNLTYLSLLEMMNDSYFDNVPEGSCVIFENKQSQIDPMILQTFFAALKGNDCKLIFVSAYDIDEYHNSDLLQLIDGYVNCPPDAFYAFLIESIDNMFSDQSFGNYSCLLLDERFVDISYEFNNYAMDIEATYNNSFVLQVILREICTKLNLNNTNNVQFILALLHSQNINILVNADGGYVNLYDLCSYSAMTVEDIRFSLQNESYSDANKFYAMGIWLLDLDFYQLLHDGQNTNYGDISMNIPVYIWEEVPVTYSPNGLWVITNSDIEYDYDVNYNDSADEDILLLLNEILD